MSKIDDACIIIYDRIQKSKKQLLYIHKKQKLTFTQKQFRQTTMQNIQQNKQSKTKYVKPQIFSVTGATRSNNPAHCRSLVDLNNIQSSSAQKQNHQYTDHFSSITSNQQNKVLSNKINAAIKYTNNSQSKQNSANISNIAKILLNNNNIKSINNNQANKNNSFCQTNFGKNHKVMMTCTRKNQLFFDNPNSSMINMNKNQVRTNSQTNLRQNNSSLPKNASNTSNNRIINTSSLQKRKSQRSLKKILQNGSQTPHPNNQHLQKQKFSNHHNNQPTNTSTNSSSHSNINNIHNKNNNNSNNSSNNNSLNSQGNKCDYSLLIKLKQYIEDLKQNQYKNLEQIKNLQNQNNCYKQQIILLRDKVQVYQIRQKQMIKKIKYMQQQINRNNNQLSNLNANNTSKQNINKNNQCHQHQLIIQSLKNVINQQMSKIIEMETYKLQLQEEKQKNRKNINNFYNNKNNHQNNFIHQNFISHHNSKRNNNDKISGYKNPDLQQQEQYLQCQLGETNTKRGPEFQEVYSFKKKNNLNQSSIYGQEQFENKKNFSPHSRLNMNIQLNGGQQQNNENICTNNFSKNNKYSQSSIPEPYNQLIKSLQTDSRLKQKNRQKQKISNRLRNKLQNNNQINEINLLNSQRGIQQSSDSQRHEIQREQIQQLNSSIKNKNSTNKQFVKYKQQFSQDQILSQVGQYLQNIRKNIKQA